MAKWTYLVMQESASLNTQLHSSIQLDSLKYTGACMRNMAVHVGNVSILDVMQEEKRSFDFNRSGTRKRFCACNARGNICQFLIEKGSHWISQGTVSSAAGCLGEKNKNPLHFSMSAQYLYQKLFLNLRQRFS